MDTQNRMKKVLCPVKNEKTDKTYWMRIGNAYINRDGSTNVYLDAYPANGRLQIRDLDERDTQPRPNRDDVSSLAESQSQRIGDGASSLVENPDGLPF